MPSAFADIGDYKVKNLKNIGELENQNFQTLVLKVF